MTLILCGTKLSPLRPRSSSPPSAEAIEILAPPRAEVGTKRKKAEEDPLSNVGRFGSAGQGCAAGVKRSDGEKTKVKMGRESKGLDLEQVRIRTRKEINKREDLHEHREERNGHSESQEVHIPLF